MKLSSSDRKALLRLASFLARGNPRRRATLAALKEGEGPRKADPKWQKENGPAMWGQIVKHLQVPENSIHVLEIEEDRRLYDSIYENATWFGGTSYDMAVVSSGMTPEGFPIANLIAPHGTSSLYGSLGALQQSRPREF